MEYQDTYIARDGVILIGEREYVGPFSKIIIPDDVWRRAGRLHAKFGRDRYEYMATWGLRKTQAEYESRQT